jgi:hypothetical protein
MSRVIELFRGVRRGVVFQVLANSVFLVGWHVEYITKATSTENDLLASALGIIHC